MAAEIVRTTYYRYEDSGPTSWLNAEPCPMVWRRANLAEAMAFMQGKALRESSRKLNLRDSPGEGRHDVVEFSDGTAVAVSSDYSGSDAADTPDFELNPPIFWIGEPDNTSS